MIPSIPELIPLVGRVFIFTTPGLYEQTLQELSCLDVTEFSGRTFVLPTGSKVTVLPVPVEKSKQDWVGCGDYTLILRGAVAFNWFQEWFDGAKGVYSWGIDFKLVKGC